MDRLCFWILVILRKRGEVKGEREEEKDRQTEREKESWKEYTLRNRNKLFLDPWSWPGPKEVPVESYQNI